MLSAELNEGIDKTLSKQQEKQGGETRTKRPGVNKNNNNKSYRSDLALPVYMSRKVKSQTVLGSSERRCGITIVVEV